MTNGLAREYWRHKPSSLLWAVELDGDVVLRAAGPIDPAEADEAILPYWPYSVAEGYRVDQERHDFVRGGLGVP